MLSIYTTTAGHYLKWYSWDWETVRARFRPCPLQGRELWSPAHTWKTGYNISPEVAEPRTITSPTCQSPLLLHAPAGDSSSCRGEGPALLLRPEPDHHHCAWETEWKRTKRWSSVQTLHHQVQAKWVTSHQRPIEPLFFLLSRRFPPRHQSALLFLSIHTNTLYNHVTDTTTATAFTTTKRRGNKKKYRKYFM